MTSYRPCLPSRPSQGATAGLVAGLATCLAALLLLGGCAGLYLDPGPTPARLEVPVRAAATPAQRAAAAEPYGGLEWAGFPPRYNEYSHPLWDVQAFILAPDGGVHELMAAPGAAVHEVEGYAIDTVAAFLAPPGQHKLRVIFTCTVRRTYYEDWGPTIKHYLYLMARETVVDLAMAPGGLTRLEGWRE